MRTSTFSAVALVALAAVPLAACGAEDDIGTSEQLAGEGPRLAYEEYQVLFTNPTCRLYKYGSDQEVYSEAGNKLEAKPKDAFCSSADRKASAERPSSPQYKLLEWINDPATTEIFFTYLSFSNSTVANALCTAIKERDVKVTFVLDSKTDVAKANQVLACKAGSGNAERDPQMFLRGHQGGIGFAHNKLFIVNPHSDRLRLVFSSGNMSSGVVLHHENWHFITVPASTYFAQVHLCMMEAELEHYQGKKEYAGFLASCRQAIPYKEESDIKSYFAPAEGSRASSALMSGIKAARAIDVGAHRFAYPTLVRELKYWLQNHKSDPAVRLVADDDMYWAGKGEQVGDNMELEYWNADSLQKRGAQVKWMETNHGEHLLHHNKFLILNMPGSRPSAVFCGAGNLTSAAFNENWENFYYVTIPAVVEAFRPQYEHLFGDLATAPEDMPTKNVLPPTQ